MENKTSILVVDDEEKNLRLLESILVPKGYEIDFARDGAEAIQKSKATDFHAILLDVMMPVMDGFEVCRNLKADTETASVPVLLVTSLDSRPDRLRGIEAGANDFISKPIDKECLLLKLRNAVYTKSLFNSLHKNYEKLKELEQLRDNLTNMIIHDLRTPLLGISGNLELLKMDPGNSEPYIANVHYAVSNIIEQVNSILEVNRLEHGNIRINLNQDNLKDIVLEAIELLGAVKSKCAIHVVCTSEPVMAFCDKNLIRRVILNLLSNAVKFTAGGGSIQIEIIAEEKGIRVRVADAGPGIPVHYHKKIFEKFGRVDTKENRAAYSIGLGLAFCKLAIEAHGGEIGVDSEEGKGSTFWFFLPNGSGECPVILLAQ